MRSFELHVNGSRVVAVVDAQNGEPLAAPGTGCFASFPSIVGHGHRVKVQARNAVAALSMNPRGLRQHAAPGWLGDVPPLSPREHELLEFLLRRAQCRLLRKGDMRMLAQLHGRKLALAVGRQARLP